MEIQHPDKARLLALWQQTFGTFGGFWEIFLEKAFVPDNCLCIREGESITAALYWFDCDFHGPWAYIFAVATHPDHRGRGLCRKLMDKTLAQLVHQGYRGALLVPADAGLRQMYKKMGFRDCAWISRFRCAAGEAPVPLSRITAAEYAQARRGFLPEGGVNQEGAMMTLLEAAGTCFYAGSECILAQEEGQRLLEYLGSSAQISGVLNALGCREAEVSAPGSGMPFAMGIAFQEDAALPDYFAFALD